MMMNLTTQTRDQFELFFKQAILDNIPEAIVGLNEMICYHFGWDKAVNVPGKRLRPLFLLLTYAAFGGKPEDAYFSAAALETLHNYTLVHDDIEDQGLTRHGQPALWTKFGTALAINVGDYLSTLSHSFMAECPHKTDPLGHNKAVRFFQQASLEVIQGQQLDISYESYRSLSVEEYLAMIRLKTSRLFAVSLLIAGSLINLEDKLIEELDQVGEKLGLGFQIQDDYLGIWGHAGKIGKSISSDLLTRKKAYPALVGLQKSSEFQSLWFDDAVSNEFALRQMKQQLEIVGAREQTLKLANAFYQEAKNELVEILPVKNEYSEALLSLIELMFAPSAQAEISGFDQ